MPGNSVRPTNSFIEFEKRDIEGSIPARFEQMVEKFGDHLAVKTTHHEWTYSRLNQEANRIARAILTQRGKGEETIALLLEQGAPLIASVLGVLKAGKAYVVMDPSFPRGYIQNILENSNAGALISNNENNSLAEDMVSSAQKVINYDALDPSINTDNLELSISPGNLAVILYTSGSTGQAKGVVHSHRNILFQTRAFTNALHLSSDDKLILCVSCGFSNSIRLIFGTLLNGASLFPYDIKRDGFVFMAEWLRDQRISIFRTIPTTFRHFLKALKGNIDFPDIRILYFGGEPVTRREMELYYRHFPDSCLVTIGYGGTEVGTVTFQFIDKNTSHFEDRIPLGEATDGCEILLLDEKGEEVGFNQTGEIATKSAYISLGYWNSSESTSKAFFSDPDGGEKRIFRSGDLGVRRPDGTLLFEGRKDFQVKVRGYRVEVAQIEKKLLEFDVMEEAIVLPCQDSSGEQRLVAYILLSSESSLTISALRGALLKKLPDYMVPSVFVILEELPLTPTGKVDRKALPEPGSERPELDVSFVAPRTPIERDLSQIWSEVLEIQPVGVNDPFLELGGDSLRATQVISRVLDSFVFEVPLQDLMEASTVASMADLIQRSPTNKFTHEGAEQVSRSRSILRKESNESCALSYAQQRMWFLSQLEPNNPLYNISEAFCLKGDLDLEALKKSLNTIVVRHETLRTVFRNENGNPVQVVQPSRNVDLEKTDLCEILSPHSEEEIQHLMNEEARLPFDLSKDLMLRVRLIRLKNKEHVLILTTHHIASDAWSFSLLRNEISQLYNDFLTEKRVSLPDLPIQYSDYALWQREWLEGEEGERQLSYWKERLADSPALLEIPTDRPRPRERSYRGAQEKFSFSSELTSALKELSRKERATLFMTLFASFQALLFRYTGSEDITIGSPIAGRTRMETEGLIGFFVNTIVLRGDLSGDPTFGDLLGRVKEVALGAYAHQDLPFEKLMEFLQVDRSLSYSPMFQVMFNFRNVQKEELNLVGLQTQKLSPFTGTSKFDLSISLQEKEGSLEGTLDYNTDLFDANTIQRFQKHYQILLEEVVQDPHRPISTLPLLTDEEEDQILLEWNDTQADYHTACIHELFEAQVERTPDTVAVVFEEKKMTYRELNERADQLAHYLTGLGVEPNALVGICLERSLEMMVGLLGVLKAGAAYVPLDPTYPEDRLAFMLEDSKVSVILTEQETAALLPKGKSNLVCLDTEREKISLEHVENVESHASSDDLAYVIYTSGSTGKPKGVQISHGALSNFLDAMTHEPGLTDRDVLLAVTTLSFDISALELFGPLMVGARVILVSQEAAFDGYQLADTIQKLNPTVMQATPATWRVLVEVGQIPNGLKILCGGEALSRELANVLLENENSLWNMYGPTETTIWSATCQIAPGDDAISIGRPIANTTLYILDKILEPVPVGVPGELHIGGAGLAQGYLNRPELTAEKFIPNPFSDAPGARLYKTGDLVRYLPDGNIEFLGRIDDQVKVRGFRIELGEIEAVLDEHPAIRESVVSAREDITGDKCLVGYLLPSSNKPPSISELRFFLKKKLPDYMVPSAFVTLDSLPLTPNGKVDRKALPAPDMTRPRLENSFMAPDTPIEKKLVAIWADLLKVDRVGIHDNFFELGGHSLLATVVISRVRDALNIELPLRSLFEYPTVAELAQTIGQREKERPSHDEMKHGPKTPFIRHRKEDGPCALSFSQERLWFLDQLEEIGSAYNISKAYWLKGTLNKSALEKALQAIVVRHDSLRTTFHMRNEAPVQVIDPNHTIELEEIDLRGKRKDEAQCLISKEAQSPFDLSQDLMLRAKLFRLEGEEHVLLLVIHHIASDGWSMGILYQELQELYAANVESRLSTLRDLPIQYADFSEWQRDWLEGGRLEESISYWKDKLADSPALLELPTDRPRPVRLRYQGAREKLTVPFETLTALKKLSQQEGLTLFMTSLAIFQMLLSRYTGSEDIAVGSPIAGRTHTETEGIVGCFINTLVLRSSLSGDPTFRQFIKRVGEVAFEAYAHQDLPFEKLVAELQPERSLSHSPLFQVMFVFQNAHSEVLSFPGIDASLFHLDRDTAHFDLTLSLYETSSGLEGTFEYNTDLFDQTTIQRMVSHFLELSRAAVNNPDVPISNLSILRDEERRQLLIEWNERKIESRIDACLHELIEAEAVRTPNAIAVVFEGEELTYRDLNQRANQVARHLLKLGVGPDVFVGLYLERSTEMVVGIMGVLKAGGAFLPLDPTYPKDRIAFMLEDAKVPVLLTQENLKARLPAHEAEVVCLDLDREIIDQESENNPNCKVGMEDLAYVIYTSGSTGRPKGTLITHEAIVSHCQNIQTHYDLCANDRVLQFASLSFDVSLEQIFPTLMAGAQLILPGTSLLAPANFHQLVMDAGLTVIDLPPVYWHQLAEEWAARPNQICENFLRLIVVGGDVMSPESLRLWKETPVGSVRLLNSYGPTEATISSTTLEVSLMDDISRRIPIGRPLPGRRIYILDANLNPVPIGVPGELYIGGVGIARGYLNCPELTAEKFIPDPFSDVLGARLYKTGDMARYLPDGNIDFLGRIDHQVKLRGFRIELGEIESVLHEHPGVRECVAEVCEDTSGEKRLVAFFVAGDQRTVYVEALRGFLKGKLPEYMIPSSFVMLESLPLTPNGKVARRALPVPGEFRPNLEETFVAPRKEMEKELAQIWSEILKVDQVGIHDNFFDLGGQSLLAFQVISRVKSRVGVEIPLLSIFELPTIVGMAKTILDHMTAHNYSKDLESILDELEGCAPQKVDPSK